MRVEELVAHVQVAAHDHLHDEEHAEDLVADAAAAGGAVEVDAPREDVAEAEEALGERVVGAGEVEGREHGGVEVRAAGEGREVREEVALEAVGGAGGRGGRALALAREEGEAVLEAAADGAADGGEEAVEEVGEEDARCYVAGAAGEGGEEGPGVGGGRGVILWGVEAREEGGFFDLDEVAVFFAEGAVPDEGREGEVEEVGKGSRLGGPGVGGSGAAEAAVEVVELVCEIALEVGVFLVGADDVWRGGVWVW